MLMLGSIGDSKVGFRFQRPMVATASILKAL